MKRIVALVLVCCAAHIFSYTACMAHSYWLEVKGSGKANETVTVMLYFGEFEKGLRENKPYMLNNMKTFSAWLVDASGKRQELTLRADTNCYKAVFTPSAEGVYTVCMKEDERGVQDWTKHGLGIVRPIEYVKAVYAVGATSKDKLLSSASMLPIDLVYTGDANCNEKSNEKTFCWKLLRDGKPLANTALTLTDAAGKQEKYSTNAAGVLTISHDKGGMRLVDVDVRDTGTGEFNGKKYEQVRLKYALTVYVP